MLSRREGRKDLEVLCVLQGCVIGEQNFDRISREENNFGGRSVCVCAQIQSINSENQQGEI